MTDTITPGSAVERALVSDRLDRIEDQLGVMGGHLAQLVEFSRRREQREAEDHALSLREREAALQERTARGTWLRSLVTRETLIRVALAVGGTGLGGWLTRGLLLATSTAAEPSELPAPPPLPTSVGERLDP